MITQKDVDFAEQRITAQKLVMSLHKSRMAQLDNEQAQLNARRAKLVEDFEAAPALLKQAQADRNAFAAAVAQSQYTSGGGAPRVRQPETALEKKLERRARLMRELAQLDAQLDTNEGS